MNFAGSHCWNSLDRLESKNRGVGVGIYASTLDYGERRRMCWRALTFLGIGRDTKGGTWISVKL